MAQQCTTYGSYENEYGREYIYPNERMYVHSSVYLPSSEIDPRTGLLKPEQPRRGRTQAMRMEYAYLDSEYKQLDEALKRRMEQRGMRMSLRSGILLIAAMSFVFAILLLSQQGSLVEQQKELNRMNRSIEEYTKANNLLADQITEASDAAAICYAAARDLNMIPAEAAEAIHLVAMDTRPLDAQHTISVTASNTNADDGSGGTAQAGAAQIPTLASAGAGY